MSKVISPSAKLLFLEAESRGFNPVWIIPELVFEFMVYIGEKKLLCHGATTHLNSQLGARICDNKILTREVTKHLNMPFIYSSSLSAINHFYDQNHPLVAKPIIGMRAEGVQFINSREKIANLSLKKYMFEKYIEGVEYRYLVLNHKVVVVQERKVIPTEKSLWHKQITNLKPSAYDQSLVDLSIKLSNDFHLGFVAVDWIMGDKPYLLELNAAPGITTAGITLNLLDAIIQQNEY